MATKKEGFWEKILTALVSGVILALISAFITYQLTVAAETRAAERRTAEAVEEAERNVRATYEARYEAAGERYVKDLGQLVDKGGAIASDNPSAESLEVAGRSIVALRDELRERLIALGTALNHEIDQLRIDIQLLQRDPKNEEQKERVRRDLLVLKEKWPGKSESVKIEIRKLLAELGIEHTNRSTDLKLPPDR